MACGGRGAISAGESDLHSTLLQQRPSLDRMQHRAFYGQAAKLVGYSPKRPARC